MFSTQCGGKEKKMLIKSFLLDTNRAWPGNGECVYLYVHTVWEYVQIWSKEGSSAGLIYLFMKSAFMGSHDICFSSSRQQTESVEMLLVKNESDLKAKWTYLYGVPSLKDTVILSCVDSSLLQMIHDVSVLLERHWLQYVAGGQFSVYKHITHVLLILFILHLFWLVRTPIWCFKCTG